MTTIRIRVTSRGGDERDIEAPIGNSLMEALRDGGCDEILALCGGCCSCGTCHVLIDEDQVDRLPVMQSDEDDLLDCSDHRDDRSRLACQVRCTPELDGLRLRIAPEE